MARRPCQERKALLKETMVTSASLEEEIAARFLIKVLRRVSHMQMESQSGAHCSSPIGLEHTAVL